MGDRGNESGFGKEKLKYCECYNVQRSETLEKLLRRARALY